MKYILKNKKIFIACTICFFILGAFSQGDEYNHEKYWYYKSRLNNDFIKVGTEAGESLPFNQRAITQLGDPRNGASMQNGFQVGDALSTLGIYIGVLATEYALLSNNQQPTDSVRHELFCALNAINRIDYLAESVYAFAGGASALNGFMIRDDIPCGFVRANYKHFNYFNAGTTIDPNNGLPFPNNSTSDKGFASIVNTGQWKLGPHNDDGSDYCAILKNGQPDGHIMSQDHVISLLVGLSLVNRYVDSDARDYDKFHHEIYFLHESGVSSILQASQNIANRLADFMGHSTLFNIENPVTNHVVTGGWTTFTQYGIAEACCSAAGYHPHPSSPFIPLLNPTGTLVPYTCHYTRNFPVRAPGFLPIWELFINLPSFELNIPNPTQNNSTIGGGIAGNDMVFKTELIAAGSSGWKLVKSENLKEIMMMSR
ncbi:MAG: hypothetical protein ACXVOH_03550 [Bacteroidia bacterium]